MAGPIGMRGAFAPVAQRLGALMQSAARYPNIKPGQEFTGYE
jgi:hypothetical protein